MSDFDQEPTEPREPAERDPAVDRLLPGEPDEVDIERGSADGSARHSEVREASLEDAAQEAGVDTSREGDDPSVR